MKKEPVDYCLRATIAIYAEAEMKTDKERN